MVMCKGGGGVTAVLGGDRVGGDTKHPKIEAPVQINETVPEAENLKAVCFQRR